jgi:hypothetical protein
MKIDLDHIHHWMCAIRSSEDPFRVLDAFWKGQIDSKIWLIENLKPFIDKPMSIDIHGGWVGVLASLLFQSDISVKSIRSIDIDPLCQPVSETMNKLEEMQGRFVAVTADMCNFQSDADIIINTSCEHISQDDYNKWLENISGDKLLVLQGNNYNIPEHIRISGSLDEFKLQCNLEQILFSSEKEFPLYTRFMIIGKKSNV